MDPIAGAQLWLGLSEQQEAGSGHGVRLRSSGRGDHDAVFLTGRQPAADGLLEGGEQPAGLRGESSIAERHQPLDLLPLHHCKAEDPEPEPGLGHRRRQVGAGEAQLEEGRAVQVLQHLLQHLLRKEARREEVFGWQLRGVTLGVGDHFGFVSVPFESARFWFCPRSCYVH